MTPPARVRHPALPPATPAATARVEEGIGTHATHMHRESGGRHAPTSVRNRPVRAGCGHHVDVEPGRHCGAGSLRRIPGRTARSPHSCAPPAAPPADRTEGGAEHAGRRSGQASEHCRGPRPAGRIVAGQHRAVSMERHRPVIRRTAFGRGGSRAPGSVRAAARMCPEPRSYSVPRLRAGSARTARLPARAPREGLCGTALAPRRAARLPAPPPSANRVKADRRAHARSPSLRHKNDRKDRIR